MLGPDGASGGEAIDDLGAAHSDLSVFPHFLIHDPDAPLKDKKLPLVFGPGAEAWFVDGGDFGYMSEQDTSAPGAIGCIHEYERKCSDVSLGFYDTRQTISSAICSEERSCLCDELESLCQGFGLWAPAISTNPVDGKDHTLLFGSESECAGLDGRDNVRTLGDWFGMQQDRAVLVIDAGTFAFIDEWPEDYDTIKLTSWLTQEPRYGDIGYVRHQLECDGGPLEKPRFVLGPLARDGTESRPYEMYDTWQVPMCAPGDDLCARRFCCALAR